LRGLQDELLDLGLGQVEVGDAPVDLDPIAADERRADVDRAEHQSGERFDQRVLLGPEHFTGHGPP